MARTTKDEAPRRIWPAGWDDVKYDESENQEEAKDA